MQTRNALRYGLPLMVVGCFVVQPAEGARSRTFAVAAGGAPVISGGLNATVSGYTQDGDRLQLSLDFGEVSPLNRNRLVVVTVPLALRSAAPYELVASLSATSNSDRNAVQSSDVGFGLRDFRAMGKFATSCGINSKIAQPFNNDPATNVDLAARAAYQSSLADVGPSRVLISGPKLSKKNVNNKNNNGYAVDAVLVIAPQFYAVGTFRVTLTLTMRPGPPLPCSE